MSAKQRTFQLGSGAQIVLRNTAPRVWRTIDGAMFMHLGHTWLGEKGARRRIEKWSAPHTDRTFTSLQSALNAWARTSKPVEPNERKTAAQLDAEIAEALSEQS